MHFIIFFTEIIRIIRFDPNFLPSLPRGRLSVVCDAALQRTRVARVVAQQAAYFENTEPKSPSVYKNWK